MSVDRVQSPSATILANIIILPEKEKLICQKYRVKMNLIRAEGFMLFSDLSVTSLFVVVSPLVDYLSIVKSST